MGMVVKWIPVVLIGATGVYFLKDWFILFPSLWRLFGHWLVAIGLILVALRGLAMAIVVYLEIMEEMKERVP